MLYQNYPNPFNPITNIKFDIPKDGFIKLIIYDILGEETVTLINNPLKAGQHEVQFDAQNYASGVYFCRLISDEYTNVIKLNLVK
jgi:hypothetical protein